MNAGAALQDGRRAAESLMVDSCIIDRPGEPVTDPDTGVVSPSYTLIYPLPGQAAPHDGRCKVQLTANQASNPEAGGAVFTVQSARVDVPVGVGPVETGDRVQVVASQSNPALVGNQYRVRQLFEKSWPTAQRIPVEELT